MNKLRSNCATVLHNSICKKSANASWQKELTCLVAEMVGYLEELGYGA